MRRRDTTPLRRGQDLCHRAFRQTLDLLRVTDAALEELCQDCAEHPDLDSLVLRAMDEMALGESRTERRAPSHVFLVHGDASKISGRIYASTAAGYRPVDGAFHFEPETSHAYASAAAGGVVVSNVDEEDLDLDRYQARFPPAVRGAVQEPIRNFVTYRIAGDHPGAIVAFNYPGHATRYEGQVLSALAITLGAVWTLSSRVAQVEEAFVYLVGALARASEVNDEVTGDHILRVSRYAEALAGAVGYGQGAARTIAYSAELHDVGKIHTPRGILQKPGALTRREQGVMRLHTVQGEKIIGTAPRLALARRIAASHHENWDGSGYPKGLRGEEIPREARLCRVVDVYDALRSERPYKRSLSHEEACRVLLEGDGRTDPARHFDPEMLDAFRRVHAEFQRIHAEIPPWGP